MEFGGGAGRGVGLGSGYERVNSLQEKNGGSRLRIGPLSSSDGAATIMVAATGIADDKLFGFRGRRILAVMNSLAEAAGPRRGGGGRERQRDKGSQEREEEQQSGGQAMHAFSANQNPKVGLA